jgi:hypothetical protein
MKMMVSVVNAFITVQSIESIHMTYIAWVSGGCIVDRAA